MMDLKMHWPTALRLKRVGKIFISLWHQMLRPKLSLCTVDAISQKHDAGFACVCLRVCVLCLCAQCTIVCKIRFNCPTVKTLRSVRPIGRNTKTVCVCRDQVIYVGCCVFINNRGWTHIISYRSVWYLDNMNVPKLSSWSWNLPKSVSFRSMFVAVDSAKPQSPKSQPTSCVFTSILHNCCY